jgi:hypothetical protein
MELEARRFDAYVVVSENLFKKILRTWDLSPGI